jgi:hypothetical protein
MIEKAILYLVRQEGHSGLLIKNCKEIFQYLYLPKITHSLIAIRYHRGPSKTKNQRKDYPSMLNLLSLEMP